MPDGRSGPGRLLVTLLRCSSQQTPGAADSASGTRKGGTSRGLIVGLQGAPAALFMQAEPAIDLR
jgi:hypothetical protein